MLHHAGDQPDNPLQPNQPIAAKVHHGRAFDALRIALPLLVLAVGVGGFLALGSRQEPRGDEAPRNNAPLVETVQVEVQPGGMTIETDGLVVPFRDVNLSAEVAGRVIEKAAICRAGNFVRQGTPLFRIDPRDYELEVQRLTKELNQAEVAIEELEVERTNTLNLAAIAEEELQIQRNELARLEGLRRQQVITQSELDRGKAAELVSRNTLVTLNNQALLLATRRNRLEGARELVATQLERARLDLERTLIHAPIDGMIVRVDIEQDAFVQRGTMLAAIDDTSAAEVSCSLKMDELYWVWRQAAAEPSQPLQAPTVQPPVDAAGHGQSYQLPPTRATILYALAGRQYAWQGVLSRYESVGLDERTRTVPCRVLIDNPRQATFDDGTPARGGPPALVRGMFVQVQLHVDTGSQLLRVPQQAIRPGSVVWSVEDDTLSIEKVPVAYLDEQWALLDAAAVSLAAGDAVVISPLAAPQDGMPVRASAAAAELAEDAAPVGTPSLADERGVAETNSSGETASP